jgi:protein FAM50
LVNKTSSSFSRGMGDRGAGTMPFHAGFKRAGTGIHTVEGNIAGSRAAALTKRREEEQQEYEKKKAKIQQDARRGALKIGDKFGGSASDQYDAMFKAQTIGLVTAEQFKQARLLASESAGQAGGAAGDVGGNIGDEDNLEKRKALIQREEEKKKRRKKKKMLAQLSFGDDVEEEGEEGQQEEAAAAKKPRKDPAVDTSFLPDREREQRLVAEREKLRAEWLETQEKVKGEPLEITYSYWDGSGHRRIIRVTKVGLVLSVAHR